MNESLPGPLRFRVVAGVVVAAVMALIAVTWSAVAVHHSVWMQAQAERAAAHGPDVKATYLGADDGSDGFGVVISFADDEHVRLADGKVVSLFHPEFPADEVFPDLGETVEVALLPGGERAVLVEEASRADEALWQLVVDWMLRIPKAVLFFAFVLGTAYAVVRLVLGFSPLALPSLLRRREGRDAVLVDYTRAERESQIVVTAAVGDDAYRWSVRVASDAPPRLDDVLRVVGHVRDGGWVVAWTEEARLLPTGPLRATDAEVVCP
ncbi:hypothetical protein [Mumia sp. DW29H23]|uniref:hypothetical protein n=1 Tax=Mumia sp. DW29H23 TaxID=3421241 RepID=UPI003D685F0C